MSTSFLLAINLIQMFNLCLHFIKIFPFMKRNYFISSLIVRLIFASDINMTVKNDMPNGQFKISYFSNFLRLKTSFKNCSYECAQHVKL